MTVEPGLYFGADDVSVPRHLRGIGVRIEDDVAVRRGAEAEVLSGGVPSRRQDVEELLREMRG